LELSIQDQKETTRNYYFRATYVVGVLGRQYFMVTWDASLNIHPRPSSLLALYNVCLRYQLKVSYVEIPVEAVLRIHIAVIYIV
jgi:hypothetical protein